MPKSLNLVFILGFTGGIPETRFTTTGKQVTTFSVCTEIQWKGKDGNPKESKEWHSVIAWEGLAEICELLLKKKGMRVHVRGMLKTRKWETDGVTHYKTEILAEDVIILDRKEA